MNGVVFGRQDQLDPVTVKYASGTVSGAHTLVPEGIEITLGANEGTKFNLTNGAMDSRCICKLSWNAGVDFVRGRITRVPATNKVYFLPLRSAGDTTSSESISVPNGATLVTEWVIVFTGVVNLEDAPERSYQIAIAAMATLTSPDAATNIVFELRGGHKLGDPWDGSNQRADGNVTIEAADDAYLFNSVSGPILTGGETYYYSILAGWGTASGTIIGDNGGFLVQRMSSDFVRSGTGGAGDASTTTTNYVSTVTVPADGDYVVYASANFGNNGGGIVQGLLEVYQSDGTTLVTQLAETTGVPRATGDRVPWGAILNAASLVAGQKVRLSVVRPGAGTAYCRSYCLMICKAPTGISAIKSTKSTTSVGASVGTTFADCPAEGMAAQALTRGRQVEILCGSFHATTTNVKIEVRPNFAKDSQSNYSTTKGARGYFRWNWYPTGASVTCRWGGFFFGRYDEASVSSLNKFQFRTTSGTYTLRGYLMHQLWLREENVDLDVSVTTPITVTADIESGLILKQWAATGTSYKYRKNLPDVGLIVRVILNGVELTKSAATDQSGMARGEWLWDAVNKNLYIYYPTGDDGNPTDAGDIIIACAAIYVARTTEDLLDSAGASIPYEPRLIDAPKYSQDLDIRDSGCQVAARLGEIQIASADRAFDGIFATRIYEGLFATIRRGYSSLSNKISNMSTFLKATLGMPETSATDFTLRLFDRNISLRQVITTVNQDIYQGTVQILGQRLPVLYGSLKRVPAVRITNNTGDSSDNTYKICGHAIKAVGNCYIDGETYLTLTKGTTDLTNATVVVNNASLPDHTSPNPAPDVLYFDVDGRTDDGTSSGRLLEYPGEIYRDILKTYGQLQDYDLALGSFRWLDRRWRKRMKSGKLYTNPGPKVALYLAGSITTTVSDALEDLAKSTFTYWYIRREGRIAVGVPDLDAGAINRNIGFEEWTDEVWPWKPYGGATAVVTTGVFYQGAQAVQVNNGASGSAGLRQWVTIEKSGWVVVTLMAASISGPNNRFRIRIVGPDDGIDGQQSDQLEITSTSWTRLSFPAYIKDGAAGSLLIQIRPCTANKSALVNIDDAECVPVAAVIDDASYQFDRVEFTDQNFYAARVTYNVNLQVSDRAPAAIITDGEARGMAAGITETKNAVNTSSQVDLGTPTIVDVYGAAGIAAALASYFGRLRHALSATLLGYTKIPQVGERVFHYMTTRIPATPDNYPIWMLTSVESDGRNAQALDIVAERHTDLITDRPEIAPQDIPMGAIVLCLSDTCPTGWAALEEVEDFYIAQAAATDAPDLTTERGAFRHGHTWTHYHYVSQHRHRITVPSLDAATPTLTSNEYRLETVDTVAGVGHAHDPEVGFTYAWTGKRGGTTDIKSTDASPTAGQATNDATHIRVRLCKRTDDGGSASPFSASILLAYEMHATPSPWTRNTSLDGKLLRGSTGSTRRAAITGTSITTSAHTFANAGFNVTLTGTAGELAKVQVGRIVKVTKGGDAATFYRAVVSVIVSTSPYVVTLLPMAESGDCAEGASFNNTSTLTSNAESAGTSETIAAANHGGTLSSHNHQATHGHGSDLSDAEEMYWGTPLTTKLVKLHSENPGFAPVAAADHWHGNIKAELGEEVSTSGNATGTVPAVASMPDYFGLVWMNPTGGAETAVPAGAMILWDGPSCPNGWTHFATADGKFLGGAATGANAASGGTWHYHTVTHVSHTFTHDHLSLGSYNIVLYDSVIFETLLPRRAPLTPDYITWHDNYHIHNVTISTVTNSEGEATLVAADFNSSVVTGEPQKPRYKTLTLCKKD